MDPSDNLLVPPNGPRGEETITALILNSAFTLEQIVSRGAASPAGFWYDQDRDEWALLLRGEAELSFESGETVRLTAGDPLLIPARCRHRVERTSPDAVWLALHFSPDR
jgi:cupin 2 domain-containing protein